MSTAKEFQEKSLQFTGQTTPRHSSFMAALINDIKVFVARSPALGDKDFCVIFHGQNQVAAAKAFNLKAKGILRAETSEMMGESFKSTTVTF